MSLKHTPATPLPWIDDGDLIIADDDGPAYSPVAENMARSDRAFAVHAANAYPRLIDALRWHTTGHGTPDLSGQKGRALLHELGEL